MPGQKYEEQVVHQDFEDNGSVVSSETDETHQEVGSLPSSCDADLDIHPCLRSDNLSPLPVEDLFNDEVHHKPRWPRKATQIRIWTVQKSKEGYDVAEKAIRSGAQHARTWSAQQSREGSDVARKKLRSGIQKAKSWGVKQTKDNVDNFQEKSGIRGAGNVGEEIQRAIREKLQQAREACENTYLRPYVPSHDSEDGSLYEIQFPDDQAWLSPKNMAIRIKLPLPPHLQSLDIPVASSVRNYQCCTYFPETDTHFVPDEEGGPFEVPAARGESQIWLKPYPEQYWDFRSSALEELKQTGKLHWRKVDRWGIPWEESRWTEGVRPVWNPEKKKWDRSMMDL
ncbi:MAG: hypothetical protein Q9195_005725 [Heterodermia aff. obscurata]